MQGASSIIDGMSLAVTVTGFISAGFTVMSPYGSMPSYIVLISIFCPAFLRYFRKPSLVGFMPVFFIFIACPDSTAAVMNGAAEDTSFGTAIAAAFSGPGLMETVLPRTFIPAPKPASIRSPWSRDLNRSDMLVRPAARSPASSSAVLTCALDSLVL